MALCAAVGLETPWSAPWSVPDPRASADDKFRSVMG